VLIEVEGDILLSKADAVGHGVAPNDDFHNGLALSIREQWPSLYKDFRHYCRESHPASGDLWTWRGPGSPTIYNLMTQEGAYGAGAKPGKATLVNVHHCLQKLRKECDEAGHKTLALSKLATGVGGLEWNDVKPVLEKCFAGSKTRVFVYTTYRKGVAAKEA
jgi:O-acetyl-ADP-ribose deacetylase (regulator of RNase III)